EDGQVILKGEVTSEADKLGASRCLRGVAGCSRVVNCLVVRPKRPQAPPVAVVHAPSDEPDEPAPQHAVKTVAGQSEEAVGSPAVDDATATIPSGLPSKSPPAGYYDGQGQGHPVIYVTPSARPVCGDTVGSRGVKTGCPCCAQAAPKPSLLERMFPSRCQS